MISVAIRCSLVFWTVSSVIADLPPDKLKYYRDISSGRGLYADFHYVAYLDLNNFNRVVGNNETSNAWIIEFYNSWCGHCLRFAPIWKKLSLDIKGWKKSIRVGAVDCSNDLNIPLCRHYIVKGYPTLKYFPAQMPRDFLGVTFLERTIGDIREAVASQFYDEPNSWLKSIEVPSLAKLWASVPGDVSEVVVVFKGNDTLGPQLALDLSETGLLVRTVVEPLADGSVYLVKRLKNQTKVVTTSRDRNEVLASLNKLLPVVPAPADLTVVDDFLADPIEALAFSEFESQVKARLLKNDLGGIVFIADLEGGLSRSLGHEIPMVGSISGDAFIALVNYIDVLRKYFPAGKNGQKYLECIGDKLKAVQTITGDEFGKVNGNCEASHRPVFIAYKGEWIGCRGSQPQFRGYPCSLWSLFHALTVQAHMRHGDDPQEVLRAMTGYIKNFFGCTSCANHFAQMAVTYPGNVTDTASSVLWLWRAHNSVNKRLHGDYTEDPHHPKVQFPAPTTCPSCHTKDGWNETYTLGYLTRLYTNVSYIVVDPPLAPTKSTPDLNLRNELVADDVSFMNKPTSRFVWDFSVFDLSLIVVLYLFSLAIILLVCIKFLRYRKTYRKKPYMYDLFQKV